MKSSILYNHQQNNFDFVRFLFATIVFYSHSFSIFSGQSLANTGYEVFFNITKGQLDGGIMNISKDTVNNMFESLPLNAINGSLWTLKYEFYCYIMILLMGAMKLLNKRNVTILFILFFIVYMFQTYGNLELTRGVLIPRLFTYFLLGSIFYFYKEHMNYNIITILFMVFIFFFFSFIGLAQVSMLIAISYLLFTLVFSRKIKLYNFAKFGDFSYGMYIYAFPTAQATLLLFKDIEFLNYFFISFIITFLLSYLSWHFIEKPSLDLVHKYKTKRKLRRANNDK